MIPLLERLLTQEFLAEMLEVWRTTVTLLAQELQKRGILRYARGRITILDGAASKLAPANATTRSRISFKIGITT